MERAFEASLGNDQACVAQMSRCGWPHDGDIDEQPLVTTDQQSVTALAIVEDLLLLLGRARCL